MKKVKISEMIEETKPLWVKFITKLGYTKEQGEKFAEGYIEGMSKLPILGKLSALERTDDSCMSAGFLAAGIDEKEALQRFESQQSK